MQQGIITVITAIGLFFFVTLIVAIYLTFKIIQFIVVAVNLYKEMVQNQKKIIELLKTNSSLPSEEKSIAKQKCPSCGAEVEADSKFCESCGVALSSTE